MGARPVGFLRVLSDRGLYMDGPNSVGRMVASGYWVCQSLGTHSAVDMADYVYRYTEQSVSWDDSASIVAASVAFLCPVFLSTPVDQPGIAPAPAPSPII